MSASVDFLRRLEWDSRHFRLEIAQLDRVPATDAELMATMREAHRSGIDCVYCLVPADDFDLAWRLESVGFVARDLRLEFYRPVDVTTATDESGIRTGTDADLDALARMSAAAFTETRFGADPGFPRAAVATLYDVWLRNSFAGFADAVLVTGPIGAPQGFVTLHSTGPSARIGLIAVDHDARGGGVGQRLVAGANHWASTRGSRELRVVTQGRNMAAQRLYQRCGFLSATAHTWYHAWPRGLRGRTESHT